MPGVKGKSRKSTPSIRAIRTAEILRDKISENISRIRQGLKPKAISYGAAMREAGFSDATASHPDLLTRTKTWKQLEKQYLPDDTVLSVHSQLNKAAQLMTKNFPSSFTEKDAKEIIDQIPGAQFLRFVRSRSKKKKLDSVVYFTMPENMVRRLAIEMAYKLKGRFAPEKIVHEFEEMTDDQLIDFIMRKMERNRS